MTATGRGPVRLQVPVRLRVEVAGRERLVTVEPIGTDGAGARLAVHWDGTTHEVDVSAVGPGRLSMILPASGRASREVRGDEPAPGDWVVGIGGRQVRARVSDGRRRRRAAAAQEGGDHAVAAPMPGRVVRVLVEPGDRVAAGQGLAVVEAMKMENLLRAEQDGTVAAVLAEPGTSLAVDQPLVEFEAP
jgi:biotin carboxyl carrier protein